jgi:hypothetical protein
MGLPGTPSDAGDAGAVHEMASRIPFGAATLFVHSGMSDPILIA